MTAAPALSFATMAVHIGEEIDRRRKATGMSKTDLAKRIGVDRSNIYDLIASPSIDTLKLKQCCQALAFNFFELLSQEMSEEIGGGSQPNQGFSAAEPAAVYGRRQPLHRAPMRLVIEIDPDDADAQAAALRMAESLNRGAYGTGRERDKEGFNPK